MEHTHTHTHTHNWTFHFNQVSGCQLLSVMCHGKIVEHTHTHRDIQNKRKSKWMSDQVTRPPILLIATNPFGQSPVPIVPLVAQLARSFCKCDGTAMPAIGTQPSVFDIWTNLSPESIPLMDTCNRYIYADNNVHSIVTCEQVIHLTFTDRSMCLSIDFSTPFVCVCEFARRGDK